MFAFLFGLFFIFSLGGISIYNLLKVGEKLDLHKKIYIATGIAFSIAFFQVYVWP